MGIWRDFIKHVKIYSEFTSSLFYITANYPIEVKSRLPVSAFAGSTGKLRQVIRKLHPRGQTEKPPEVRARERQASGRTSARTQQPQTDKKAISSSIALYSHALLDVDWVIFVVREASST